MKVKNVYCWNCDHKMGEMNIKKLTKNQFEYMFVCLNCGHTADGKGVIDEDDTEG